MNKTRCDWAGNNPLYVDYHDNEWGYPVKDDDKLLNVHYIFFNWFLCVFTVAEVDHDAHNVFPAMVDAIVFEHMPYGVYQRFTLIIMTMNGDIL
jgi:hypothetical protein